jgi:glycosyltransferase involved in cell wall biosynthesis
MPDVEILVVDDQSTDNTWRQLQAYFDPRLSLVRNERNLGIFGNFTRCIHLARSPYVLILPSDDALLPGWLPQAINKMDRHPDVSLLGTQGRVVDTNGNILRKISGYLRPGWYAGDDIIDVSLWLYGHYTRNFFNFPSGMLIRRSTALDIPPFDEQMLVAADVDFFLNLLRRGNFLVEDAVGCKITYHSDQASVERLLNKKYIIIQEWDMIIERHKTLLQYRRNYAIIKQQMAAQAFEWSLRYQAKGLHEHAYRCFQLALQINPLSIGLLQAFVRSMTLRAFLRLTRIYVTPFSIAGK